MHARGFTRDWLKGVHSGHAGYALNLYWMQAIFKGAIKAIRRPTTKKRA